MERVACFDGVEGLALGLRSVPQTGQREAVSDKRVPHVGQICVLPDGLSGLIYGGKLYLIQNPIKNSPIDPEISAI